jgi:CBS domain-containing protein
MATVQDILKKKGNKVVSVPPTATIMEALKEMADNKIGSILVMEGKKAVGIFSERDYARRVKLEGKDEGAAVREVMTKYIYYVGPTQTVMECMAQMTDKHIRHLPVVENGELIGIISIGDVVKEIICDQEDMINSMEKYILGKEYNH